MGIMSDTDQDTPSTAEMTEPRPATGEPEYLLWAERKIRKSIADDDANPQGRASLDAVMKKHGVR